MFESFTLLSMSFPVAFNPQAPVDRLVDLLLTIVQPLFWAALCLGFVLAGAHFLTMLATRWGEKRVSSKSLFFSMAVHFSMGCGLVALIPEYRQQLLRFIDPEQDQPIKIKTVIFEADRTTRETESGNTPIWDKLAKTEADDLTRFDQTMEAFEPDVGPQPRPEPLELDDRKLPDVDTLPERPPSLPEQMQAATEGLKQQAVMPLNVEKPTTMANEDRSIPTMSRDRAAVSTPDQVSDVADRQPRQGSVDRPRAEYAPQPDMASIQARSQQIAALERRQNDEIRRREGPAPSDMQTPEIGRSDNPSARGDVTPPGPSTLTRSEMQQPRPTTNESFPTRERTNLTPRTPTPLDNNPLAVLDGMRSRDRELPNVKRQNFDPLSRDDLSKVPAAYQMRAVDQRKIAARQFGGTEESEQAVELALKWMASTQQADGHWDAGKWGAGSAPNSAKIEDRPNSGADADTGVTALATLAFLGAGHTSENGDYAPQVRKALDWIISQQLDDGYLGARADHVAGMYCHGMATFALAEAYAMRSDPAGGQWLREPVERAVGFIVSQQIADGSWRYVDRANKYGDMSMFGWQFMALKSASAAGIPTPIETQHRLTQFLKDMSLGQNGGLAAYRKSDPPSAAMTAEALFCKQMLGLPRTSAASQEATRYLIQQLPNRPRMNLYYWYYGTLSMFQYGGERWQAWNESLRDLLVTDQIRTGQMAGTWDPKGDEWGLYGGRMYSTAMATLCLEVYYRYLPLYKMGGQYEEAER